MKIATSPPLNGGGSTEPLPQDDQSIIETVAHPPIPVGRCSLRHLLDATVMIVSLITPFIKRDDRGQYFVAGGSQALGKWADPNTFPGRQLMEPFRARHQVARVIIQIVKEDRSGARVLVSQPESPLDPLQDDLGEVGLDRIERKVRESVKTMGSARFYDILARTYSSRATIVT